MQEKDPLLEQAAERVAAAHEALVKALFLLHYRPESRTLKEIASYLGTVADNFKAGKRDEGLRLELVDRRWAARVMGRNLSTEKKMALTKARAVLAQKRAFLKTGVLPKDQNPIGPPEALGEAIVPGEEIKPDAVASIISSPSSLHNDSPVPTEVASMS
jgi:hypothetical protein